ncbi:MAG: hypothetical protein AB7V08_10705, partial [Elusimicrobiales bacterium]
MNEVYEKVKRHTISGKKLRNAEFFAPFNYYSFEENKKCRNRKNRRAGTHGAARIRPYSLLLSDEL